MAAACKRLISLSKSRGLNASAKILDMMPQLKGTSVNFYSSVSSSSAPHRLDYRQISQLVKHNANRAFLVDTLALVRSLEAQGLPSNQAEAITAAITKVLNDSLENVSNSFVSTAEMQKEQHFSLLQRETEKLRNDIEKMHSELSLLQRETEKLRNDDEKLRSELRYEIDKGTAGQRLDANLERGRIRDELANQNAEISNLTNNHNAGISNLTNKIDREIHALKTQLEAAKYEVIKYCIGTLVSLSAIGLAVIRVINKQ